MFFFLLIYKLLLLFNKLLCYLVYTMSTPEDNENPLEENTKLEEKSDTIERFDGIYEFATDCFSFLFNFYIVTFPWKNY